MQRLLSRKEVRSIVTLSLAHIDRLEAAGRFPQRIRLTDHKRGRCAYLADDIAAWIEERIAASSRKPTQRGP